MTLEVLNRSFERAWKEIEEEIGKIEFVTHKRGARTSEAKKDSSGADKMEQILEELLSISRSQMKVLRSPEDILPVRYLMHALEQANLLGHRPPIPRNHPAWRSIFRDSKQVVDLLQGLKDPPWSGEVLARVVR